MFSFNFAVDDGSNIDATAPLATPAPPPAQTHHTRHGERFVWHPSSTASYVRTLVPVAGDAAPPVEFELVNTADAAFIAQTGTIRSILSTSDVEAGVYEGGFKLWECSLDLVQYVELLLRQSGETRFEMPRKVMELGCGHGIPGIHALQRGAEHVTFMDYNKEVLELTTCPNVYRNVRGDASAFARASFYAGAWASVSAFMQRDEAQSSEQMQCDLILTAETIYTEAVTVELYEMIKRHLRPSATSMALVAAKKYYFGTGGSVQHFLDLVQRDGVFCADVVWAESDCRSNIREIVRVTFAPGNV